MLTQRFLLALALGIYATMQSPSTAAPSPAPILNVPNTSNVAPAGPPVEVEDCKLQSLGGLLIAKTGKLQIEFTNEGSVAADLVRFRISWGSSEAAFIRDQGKFAPGITVKHEFRQSEGALISPLFSHPHLQCSVESVHFADGTQWTNPAAAIVSNPSSIAGSTAVNVPRIVGSSFIGVELQQTGLNQIQVRLVLPGGPADRGGLRQSDVIELINGEHVSGMRDATELITAAEPGTTLQFVVNRDGAQSSISITTARRAQDAPIDGPV